VRYGCGCVAMACDSRPRRAASVGRPNGIRPLGREESWSRLSTIWDSRQRADPRGPQDTIAAGISHRGVGDLCDGAELPSGEADGTRVARGRDDRRNSSTDS